MRRLAVAILGMLALTVVAEAKDFPGPAVRNVAPFNNSNVRSGGGISCPKIYTKQQTITEKRAIVEDIKQCVRQNFGIEKDIGLGFGSSPAYDECVVPATPDARPPANNPLWPVCCLVPLRDNTQYRMTCRIFFTTK